MTRKAAVTAVKKSQATIAGRDFSGRWTGAGLATCVAGAVACCTWRRARRAESGASTTVRRRCVFLPRLDSQSQRRRIKSLISVVTRGLPSGLDFQGQKRRNAARCQPITVAGLTIINALRQSNQRPSFENTNLSAGVVGSVSSRVHGIEPTACARTDFPLPEPNGGARY